MYWAKLVAKFVVLVLPIFLVLAGTIVFVILPRLDPVWTPLVFVAAPLTVLIANWIWPLDSSL